MRHNGIDLTNSFLYETELVNGYIVVVSESEDIFVAYFILMYIICAPVSPFIFPFCDFTRSVHFNRIIETD